jgi:ribosomal protein S18 acetylase RimI-like enzyme
VSLTVRVAGDRDAEAVGALSVVAYREDGYLDGIGGPELGADLADGARRVREATVLVAETDDGELVGTVTLAEPGSPYAETAEPGEIEVRMLAVAPAARRQGIAAALMEAAHAEARQRGMRRVVLCSEASYTQVHRFYERLGYQRQPERDWTPGGVPLLSFGRPVDAS